MSWATQHIENLKKGETVRFRPKGNSMTGRVNSGDLCTVIPIQGISVKTDDVVLCKVKGNQYLHLVKAIKGSGDSQSFLIGNNRGGENGWISSSQIFGKCIRVE